MARETGCCSTHLLDGNGTFNGDGLDNFIEQIKLKDCGVSYVVVAIMGPQSSGKSTLLNHLFRTNFTEMDAYKGRSQTTKGIWMARCLDIEPCTVVMDLEGSDGRERGENDTAFEKQIALFGLAVSDIVLINMWCHSIGLDQGANKPLLRIVFEVMLRLFTSRKTTLMFVIRDKTPVTPLERLECTLREDIQKIWDGVPKPQEHKKTLLSDFFNVQVVGLTSYQERPEQFTEEVASLREKFFRSTTLGGLAGDRRGVVPASGFSFSAKHIWEVIKENKDLDLPAHKVMVSTIRCEEVAYENYSSFVSNKDWLEIEEASQLHFVQGFGNKIRSLLHDCLSSYDEDATYFEESARSAKRKQLEEKLIQHVQPAYHLMLEHITSITLGDFKQALTKTLNERQGFVVAARDCKQKFMTIFDERCQDVVISQANWDSTKVLRNKFSCDLDSHIVEVQTSKLAALTSHYKAKLKERVFNRVEGLLKKGGDDTWQRIRKLVSLETRNVISEFELWGFEDEQTKEMKSNLINYARELVKKKTRQEVDIVLSSMKERFISLFNHDKDSKSRTWIEDDDIPAITKTARSSCLKLLHVLATIRLDEDETDKIWDTLVLALDDPKRAQITMTTDTWENVPVTKTLITPMGCKSLWDRFVQETDYAIVQANTSRDADTRNNLIKKVSVGVLSTLAVATGGVSAAATGAALATFAGAACLVNSIAAGAVASGISGKVDAATLAALATFASGIPGKVDAVDGNNDDEPKKVYL